MNNIERIDIGTEMYTSLTHQDLDDLLGKLGVGEYKEVNYIGRSKVKTKEPCPAAKFAA